MTTNLMSRDEITIYVFAYRYAASRMTYARGLVFSEIQLRIKFFTLYDLEDLLKTSEESLKHFQEYKESSKEHFATGSTADIDIDELKNIISYFKHEIETRKLGGEK